MNCMETNTQDSVGVSIDRACLNDGIALVVYVTAGDPSLAITKTVLTELANSGVSVIELCVPFPDSFTDGEVILRSHQRGLDQGVNLDDVLCLHDWAKEVLGVDIILLCDYCFTVKPLGLGRFIELCAEHSVSGTLLHGLPPRLSEKYFELSLTLGVSPVVSFYNSSKVDLRRSLYKVNSAFIYVVSQFGKSGYSLQFDESLLSHMKTIRSETERSLALGFGVSTGEHLHRIKNTGFDAAIIGSPVTKLIESASGVESQIVLNIENYFHKLWKDYHECEQASL